MKKNVDSKFLKCGNCLWSSSDAPRTAIEWTFVKYEDTNYPISIVECNISGWGYSARGFGANLLEYVSYSKAFGEAWERLWLLKYTKEMKMNSITSSNGFASALTNESALFKSAMELKERRILKEAWDTKSGWVRVKPASFKSKLLNSCLEFNGWKVGLYEIRSNIGNSAACLIMNSDSSYFDTALDSNIENAKYKVLTSALKGAAFSKFRTLKSFNLPKDGQPKDHVEFYSNPENFQAFDFLECLNSQIENGVNIQDESCTESSLLCKATDYFPAVAFSVNRKWPQLKWGLHSIDGGNAWPHPLG